MASGAVEFSVSSNAASVSRVLHFIARDQLPFATALALTRVGAAIQRGGREQLDVKFRIRAPWMRRAMATSLVRKSDWPNQQIRIGHPFWKMALHEVGGTLTGGSKHPGEVFIPTRAVASMRGANGKIPNEMQPHVLIARGKARVVQHPSAGLALVMHRAQRLNKTARRRAQETGGLHGFGNILKVAYLVRPRATIRATFGFHAISERTARESYPDIFRQAFEEAVATAKRRA